MVPLNEAVYRAFIQQEDLTLEEARTLIASLLGSAQPNKQVVGVREFMLSPYYMNAVNADGSSTIYPAIMDALEELNHGHYDEAVLTGSIGSGKTTLALYTQAYQLYLLSCYDTPHALFGLDSASEILFIFQSLNARAAVSVDYQRFRAMIERSPYFKKFFPYDRHIKSELVFPNRIIVRPLSGSEYAAIGQNVIGGLIDEVNFMAVVQRSKRSVEGGTYDQAKALYDSIDRRRESRFMTQGKLPGILCLSSSKRYPGEFTDQKIAERDREIVRHGHSTIYLYDKRAWEVKPHGTYCGKKFRVFAGDMYRKPRLLSDNEQVPEPDEGLVVDVPVEFRPSFEKDIMGALRDIAGVATMARHPFIMNSEAVTQAFGAVPSIFNRETVDFVQTHLSILKGRFHKPELPRFAHVDLALTGDSAGLAVGHVTAFRAIQRFQENQNQPEPMPEIRLDGVLEVQPPRGGEILLHKIRRIFYVLRELGMNLRWVTFDGFQSADSLQLLRQEGFTTGYQSVDKTVVPYEFTKQAIYDGRLTGPAHSKLHVELASLEKDVKRGKIDHPVSGSKDCSDAVAGVVYGLTMRREIWALFGIPIIRIPSGISQVVKRASTEPEGICINFTRDDGSYALLS